MNTGLQEDELITGTPRSALAFPSELAADSKTSWLWCRATSARRRLSNSAVVLGCSEDYKATWAELLFRPIYANTAWIPA